MQVLQRAEMKFSDTNIISWLVAREDRWHFAKPPRVFPRNDVWETSADIPFWWRVTTQIWVVLQMGWKLASTNQKHYPDLASTFDWMKQISHAARPISGTTQCLGSDTSSVWNLRSQFAEKPGVASRNVGCFPRLPIGLNPLSPKSDMHQISPCNINAL